MQITGDLLMYWHLRGKNLTARDYSNQFLETDPVGAPSRGRVGALLTAGLASWMLGLLDRAERGHPAVGLIAGDAGVGKTRLLDELAARAGGAGIRVLVGGCMEVGDVGLPYVPFVMLGGRVLKWAGRDPRAPLSGTGPYFPA